MSQLIRRFLRDDSGATAIEYGLIGALIFLAVVGSITLFAGNATTGFNGAMATIAARLT